MAESGSQFGRYEILRTLGRGGFATVYQARDTVLGREVALKVLSAHLAEDEEIRHRFLREARSMAALRHPNIVTVFDFGEVDGRPYLTMELMTGGSLAASLGLGNRLDIDTAVGLLTGLCDAIDYLHAAGVVHRDIKPANVLVDSDGRAALADFGIARVLDQASHTRTGLALGTPEYMAPEQVRGAPIGPAADIYALGTLTYHMLGGRPPFVGDTAQVLHAQAYEAPKPLKDVRPGLSPTAYAVIESALAKAPDDRPASARQLVAALSELTPPTTVPILPSTASVATPAGQAPTILAGTPTVRAAITSQAADASAGRRWLARRALVAGATLALVVILGGVALVARLNAGGHHTTSIAAVTARSLSPVAAQPQIAASPSPTIARPPPPPAQVAATPAQVTAVNPEAPTATAILSATAVASPSSSPTPRPNADTAITVGPKALIYMPNQVGGNFHQLLVVVENTSPLVAIGVTGQIAINQNGVLLKSVNPTPVNILPHSRGLFVELVNLSTPANNADINVHVTVSSFRDGPSDSPVQFSKLAIVPTSFGTCSITGQVDNRFSVKKDNLQLRVAGFNGDSIVTGGFTYVNVVFPGEAATFELPEFSAAMCPKTVEKFEVYPNLGEDKIFNP